MTPAHVFSVDVEDWYQSSYDYSAPISEICVKNTRRVLELLSRHEVQGTFFVQGLVARQYPHLVKEIKDEGHEVQSHGYSHRPVNMMTPAEFRRELTDTSKLIEDITGTQVTGFRAPDFSIDEKSFWAFEVMIECGICYDSSIFPIKTPRYGISGFQMGYSTIRTASGKIDELTVSLMNVKWLKQVKIPVGGGGYFRLLPRWILRYSLRRVEEQGFPFVIYCHPYEFNPNEWKQVSTHVPIALKLYQGLGRKGFQRKVTDCFEKSPFGKMAEVIKRMRDGAAHEKPVLALEKELCKNG